MPHRITAFVWSFSDLAGQEKVESWLGSGTFSVVTFSVLNSTNQDFGHLGEWKKTAKWSVTGCTLSQNGYRPKFTIHVFTFIASEVTFSLHEPYGISHVNIIVCWGCNLNCHEKRQLPICVLLFEIIFKINLHPGRLRWNLQITHLERKMIFQTSMIMFPANLQGCRSKGTSWSFQTKNNTMLYFGLSTFPCSSGRWGFIGIPPLNHYTSNNPGCWLLLGRWITQVTPPPHPENYHDWLKDPQWRCISYWTWGFPLSC